MASMSKEELLALIEDDFRDRCAEDATIQRLLERVGGDKVSYDDVQAYSKRLGQLLSKSYLALVTAEAFPKGLTLEAATAAIKKPLVDTFYEAASAAAKYIEAQNKAAGLGIKAIAPKHDAERVGNLATAVSKKPIEEARTLLEEPVVNHTMSAVDETVKANGRVMSKLGVGVKIIRRAVGSHTCDWCKGLAGSYDYNDVNQGGHDVWRRHAYCDCKIEYVSKADTHTVKNYVKGNQTANQRKVAARREARMPDDRSAEKANARKHADLSSDSKEYSHYKRVLGEKKTPINLQLFAQMKYNEPEKYAHLKDAIYIKEKFDNGVWKDVVNPEKQARHIQGTAPEGKSYFFENVNIEALYEKYKTTGYIQMVNGKPTSNEKVDLDESDVGVGFDVMREKLCNAITIKYSKTGVHVIPIYYDKEVGG